MRFIDNALLCIRTLAFFSVACDLGLFHVFCMIAGGCAFFCKSSLPGDIHVQFRYSLLLVDEHITCNSRLIRFLAQHLYR